MRCHKTHANRPSPFNNSLTSQCFGHPSLAVQKMAKSSESKAAKKDKLKAEANKLGITYDELKKKKKEVRTGRKYEG